MLLVTGASGFVGRYLTNRISSPVRYVVKKGLYHDFYDSYEVDSIDGSANWDGAFRGIDTIIHLAGVAHKPFLSNEDYQSVNNVGTIHLAREAAYAGVKRFVFVSSIGVNGSSSEANPFTFDEPVKPHNVYSESKYRAELGLKELSNELGLEVVIIRPTLVYGPNAPGNFGLLTKLVEKLPVLPFGLTKNRRSFISVQNLADLLVTCARHPNAAGHTFLASEGETVSMKEFTDAIANGLDKKIVQLPIPVSLMRLVGRLIGRSSMVEQLVGNLEVDSSNLKNVLNWTPPLTMRQAMETLRTSGTK